jgi:hypothetical protein
VPLQRRFLFLLNKSFKINITGEPNSRIFIGATNLGGWQNRIVLEQAF